MTTPTPKQPPNDSTRRAGLIGGVIGAIALVAALFALSVGANASETELVGDSPVAAQAVAQTDADDDAEEDIVESDSDEGELEDEETDDGDLDDLFAEMEEQFEEFEACLAENGVEFEKFDDTLELPEFDIEEFELEDIDPEKLEELFGDMFGDLEDFEFPEFDGDFGPDVSVMDDGELTIADFGDGDGTITITKTGDDITVTSTGDVDLETVEPFGMLDGIIDGFGFGEGFEFPEFDGEGFDFPEFDEMDEAFTACQELLPEDVFGMKHGFLGGAIEKLENA
ncbi:MAG: hypothetical protein HKN94_08290 [Acidimicrobiales bacterium]|nr:hypothetical protein [Acidimicrobiales bacterium]